MKDIEMKRLEPDRDPPKEKKHGSSLKAQPQNRYLFNQMFFFQFMSPFVRDTYIFLAKADLMQLCNRRALSPSHWSIFYNAIADWPVKHRCVYT